MVFDGDKMIDCDCTLKRNEKKRKDVAGKNWGVNLKVPFGHGSGADVPTGQ